MQLCRFQISAALEQQRQQAETSPLRTPEERYEAKRKTVNVPVQWWRGAQLSRHEAQCSVQSHSTRFIPLSYSIYYIYVCMHHCWTETGFTSYSPNSQRLQQQQKQEVSPGLETKWPRWHHLCPPLGSGVETMTGTRSTTLENQGIQGGPR